MVSNSSSPLSLKEHVRIALNDYFDKLDGEDASHIYEMVMAQIEPPMLETVMKHAGGNQVRAARFLGLARGTLRRLLAKYPFMNFIKSPEETGEHQ